MNEKRGTQTMSEELKYNEPWILQRADPYVYAVIMDIFLSVPLICLSVAVVFFIIKFSYSVQ